MQSDKNALKKLIVKEILEVKKTSNSLLKKNIPKTKVFFIVRIFSWNISKNKKNFQKKTFKIGRFGPIIKSRSVNYCAY